jgi:hypothetical protein
MTSNPKTDERQLRAKRQWARQKLKVAAVAVLDLSAYHQLKVTDVTQETGVAKGDWFGRLYSHFYKEVKSYAEHPCLRRCLEFFAESDVVFRKLWRDSYDRQLRRLIDVIPGVFPDSCLSEAERQLIVYSLSGVGREVLKRYYIEKEISLGGHSLQPEEMAEWLSVVYYRGLFATNPPSDSLRFADKILNIQK